MSEVTKVNMKWIHDKSEVPKEPHFAIIEFSSIWIPGDERSRTNPGHGYPEHTENTCEYIVFECEGEWKNEIEKRINSHFTGGGNNFVAVRVTPATVKTTVNVSIK